MRTIATITLLISTIFVCIAFNKKDSLRKLYSGKPSTWPKPFIEEGLNWKELASLPAPPLDADSDSIKHLVELGKILFFEPRLSGSGKISCASCHQPKLSWTDGKQKSAGHEGQANKRNSPSLQNVWFYEKLFWDGRSHSLEDQAFAPINSESEMHGDMRELPRNLKKIKGYGPLFTSAFGDREIDPDRIALALASFQRTIISRKSKLDNFIDGDKNALSDKELRGLHIFRTKAKCMNCHNGPLFTDNKFHNNGFAGDDPGMYNVTHNEADRGKFKTPSLRDVFYTGPWMHDGMHDRIESIIDTYNRATPVTGRDRLINPLHLSKREKADLRAFLLSISSSPLEFDLPGLPE